jgi:hypothetical protein
MTNKITTVAQADKVDMTWVAQHIDLEQARANYMPIPRNNLRTRHQFTIPLLGTWQMDDWGQMSVLVDIPVDQFQPGEGEWDIALNYPETQLYIQWQREGHEPPPLTVVTTDKGNLCSCNRRRWLAAREAGVKSLKCWYSPTHPDHCASPKFWTRWLND